MEKTNDKIEQLKEFIEERNNLLIELKEKEDISNLSQNEDVNLADIFESTLNKCKECDLKIKEYKTELEPRFYLNFWESEYSKTSTETSLVVKKENKIIGWFKNKIKEFKYNYAIERAIKRDNFIEENISNSINSYSAYLNVIKEKGNKAIFKKYINNSKIIKNENLSDNNI